MKTMFTICFAMCWLFIVAALFFQIGHESKFTAADASTTLIVIAVFCSLGYSLRAVQ